VVPSIHCSFFSVTGMLSYRLDVAGVGEGVAADLVQERRHADVLGAGAGVGQRAGDVAPFGDPVGGDPAVGCAGQAVLAGRRPGGLALVWLPRGATSPHGMAGLYG
jgi:hypothetical protein